MTGDVYQILYVSSASRTVDESDLLEIMGQARKNNKKNDVTGLLLFAEGNIVQLLEGDKEIVESTFESISRDPRHTGIIRLVSEYSESRDFADWSMGFQRIGSISLTDIEGFNDLLENKELGQDQLAAISQRMRILFETFRKTARI
jgi:hypothetical protein